MLSTLASAQDAVGSFEITRFDVVGDTMLGAQPIAQLLSPFTGRLRNFGDVQQALEALEAAYRARGLSLVRVTLPEQELNKGTVRLVVTESHVGTVQILGNKQFSNANIRNSVPQLQEGQPPNVARISASLRLANENPAKKTVLSLQNGDNDDEVNAVLQVTEDKPWLASLSLDNAGNDATGKTQVTAQFQHFNVGDLDHTLSLQFTTTLEQPSRVGIYGVGYHIPLYSLTDALDFYGSYSDVDSGTVSTGAFNLQVSGKGSVWGGRYTHNLPRQGSYESRLAVGLEQKAFQNNLGYQGMQIGNDVTVRPLSLLYAGDLTHGAGATSYYLMGVRNVPGGDRGGDADFARVRAGASSNYGLWRFGISHTQTLPSDWQLRLLFNGQWTADALVPGEQFGAGGAASVRGYSERALADDQGGAANIEVYTPSLCSSTATSALQCRLLAFYDRATVRHNNALPGERTDASLASAGVGLRLGYGKQMSLQMDIGQALLDSDTQSKGDTRVHAKINLAY